MKQELVCLWPAELTFVRSESPQRCRYKSDRQDSYGQDEYTTSHADNSTSPCHFLTTASLLKWQHLLSCKDPRSYDVNRTCQRIHEGPGFRIPASNFLDSGFWILDSGFRIPYHSGFRFQTIVDSEFQSSGFRIPTAKICWIPDLLHGAKMESGTVAVYQNTRSPQKILFRFPKYHSSHRSPSKYDMQAFIFQACARLQIFAVGIRNPEDWSTYSGNQNYVIFPHNRYAHIHFPYVHIRLISIIHIHSQVYVKCSVLVYTKSQFLTTVSVPTGVPRSIPDT